MRFSVRALTIAAFTLLANAAAAEVLVFGSLHENVRKQMDQFAPMAAHLQAELAEYGITDVRLSVLNDADQMALAVASGEVDLFYDSPLTAAKIARASGGTPVLRRWKKGEATYLSIIAVPSDSGLNSIDDLVGHTIGFEEKNSTSGFMLPMYTISRRGLPLVELATRDSTAIDGTVGYIFTQDDLNTMLWLTKGWIDAGAFDPRSFQRLQEARPGQFKALGRSMEVPRQTIVARPGMTPELLDGVKTALIEMKDSQPGRDAMRQFNKTSQFDEFPDGAEATFAPIYDMLDHLATLGIH